MIEYSYPKEPISETRARAFREFKRLLTEQAEAIEPTRAKQAEAIVPTNICSACGQVKPERGPEETVA